MRPRKFINHAKLPHVMRVKLIHVVYYLGPCIFANYRKNTVSSLLGSIKLRGDCKMPLNQQHQDYFRFHPSKCFVI